MDSVFPKNLTTKQAVIATLAYFKCFDVAITKDELNEHLCFMKPDPAKIDIYLRESPFIIEKNGYISLKNGSDPFAKMTEKDDIILSFWKKVKRYQFIFSICPFVKWIGVCNSLPIRDIDEESDIDLFVVTYDERIFTARFFLTLLTTIFGVRRHGKKVKKRFCLSFYMSESASDLSKLAIEPYDIYLPFWAKTIEPVAGDYSAYQEFLNINSPWLKKYFSTINERKRFFRSTKKWQMRLKKFLERRFYHGKWEQRFRKHQKTRAEKKRSSLTDTSGTIISDEILKFHDNDSRHKIRSKWESIISEKL